MIFAIVFLVAFAVLVQELLLARLYIFFLGEISAFLAIPVIMLGLALGALVRHELPNAARPESLPRWLLAQALLTTGAFVAAFALFNHVFGMINFLEQNPFKDAARTVVFTLIFTPGIAVAGIVLASVFARDASSIRRTYAADLAGSALACGATVVSLRYLGLPETLCLLFATQAAALALAAPRRRRPLIVVAFGALAVLTLSGTILRDRITPEDIRVPWEKSFPDRVLAEAWDEGSRLSLLQYGDRYRLIHNGSASNVAVEAYAPEKPHVHDAFFEHYRIPFLLDQPPRSALVLFAGTGRDMIHLDELAGGDMPITGVELSRLVPRMVTTPPFDLFRLREFYGKPNIDYRIEEGRAYLQNAGRHFDLIFVASRGTQDATRYGNTRLYLDSLEAHRRMFQMLSPGGVIVFHYSPFHRDKLEIVKRIFSERPFAPFAQSALRVSQNGDADLTDTWIFKPLGFTPGELQRLRAEVTPKLTFHYAPDAHTHRASAEAVEAPLDPTMRVPTDDRPYQRALDFSRFTLFPAAGTFAATYDGLERSSDWVKIFTLLFFTLVSAAVIAAFYRRGPRLPASLALYFLVSGFCYMVMQLILMAKVELIVGQPVLAIAIVLTAFLVFNALGSLLATRWSFTLALAVAPASFFALELIATSSAALSVKIVMALVALAPFGIVAGSFYPLGVGVVARRGLEGLLPKTFGLATISSVLGGCFTLVLCVDLGFRNLLGVAELGYLALAALAWRQR